MKPQDEKRIEVEIGQRLYALRRLRRLSQEELALRLGITYQQIQKYEKGVNRIAASRLYALSLVLNVSPLYFFDGLCECKTWRKDCKVW